MNLPEGLPPNVAEAFETARANNSQLFVADTLVTTLTQQLADATQNEANVKIAARESLKTAESSLDDFVAQLRTQLEAYVVAPTDPTPQA